MKQNLSLSLETKGKPRELNKTIPHQMSEELRSLLNDNSLKLKHSELEILRRFEREALDFESPQCPICDEGNAFLFRVSGNSCYWLSRGYYWEK